MQFSRLTPNDKVSYIKEEFSVLIKSIFDNPEILKSYIKEQQISNAQSKVILNLVNKFNSKTCVCCRRYDPSKVSLLPVNPDLEPILDIARTNAEKRSY